MRLDLTAHVFGKLTVIEETMDRSVDGCIVWRCECECGNSARLSTNSLRSGGTKSCGCLCIMPQNQRRKARSPEDLQAYLATRRFTRLQRYADNPQPAKDSARRWHVNNRDKSRASLRKWRTFHPEADKQARRQEYERIIALRPWVLSEKSHIRRARKKGAEGHYSHADIARIYALQRGRCAVCSTDFPVDGKRKYDIDHVIPLARGGSNWPSNLQLLCQSCNGKKAALLPVDWFFKRLSSQLPKETIQNFSVAAGTFDLAMPDGLVIHGIVARHSERGYDIEFPFSDAQIRLPYPARFRDHIIKSLDALGTVGGHYNG